MTTPANVEHGPLSDARTVGEAKHMACPFMAGKPCLGNECMGWRWIGHAFEHTAVPPGLMPEGDGWVSKGSVQGMAHFSRPRSMLTRKGYCGAIPGTALVIERDV